MNRMRHAALLCVAIAARASPAQAQAPSAEDAREISARLAELRGATARLATLREAQKWLPDVEICAKAAEWIVRHEEFYAPEYGAHTLEALATGLTRAAQLEKGAANWGRSPGRTMLGYRSAVDESLQPYALSLPAGFNPRSEERLPLQIVLHGRGSTLNEV